ncbi:hypothetical protein AB0E01_17150 [Nocardia vinacea]|uniref:hypothetical protein n=1 Tax=Nocardia vinacea TaxID=96468 RepID=UPI0033DC964B
MRHLLVPVGMTTSGVSVAGLVFAGAPVWISLLVAAPALVWWVLVVVLAVASVFCGDQARRDAAYRTLVLVTSLRIVSTLDAGTSAV